MAMAVVLGLCISAQATSLITTETLADRGYAAAQLSLGTKYDVSGASAQDIAKAVYWYTKRPIKATSPLRIT